MKIRYSIFLLLLTLFAASCSDNNGTNPDPLELSSVYVANEGNFSQSNGTITSYNPESDSTALKAFETVNGRPFAGYIQTSKIVGDRMFIVSNQANKVEVVEKSTLESMGTIQLSASPTAIGAIGNTAYVGIADFNNFEFKISLVDLSTMEMTGESIPVSSTPRDIVQVGGKLYVTNNGGNTVTVINPEDNTVTDTITVGASPNEMLVDNENRIWLLCNGKIPYDGEGETIPGSLYILDGQNAAKIDSITTGIAADAITYKKRLALNTDQAKAYLINDGISAIDMNTYDIEQKIVDSGSFYSIGYFDVQDRLYLGKINGFTQPGKALIYDLQGTAVDSFNVGIVPNDFHFIQN